MATRDKLVTIEVALSEERAAALAQFVKRLLLDDCINKCSPAERESAMHYQMQSALFDVGQALAEKGFNPR